MTNYLIQLSFSTLSTYKTYSTVSAILAMTTYPSMHLEVWRAQWANPNTPISQYNRQTFVPYTAVHQMRWQHHLITSEFVLQADQVISKEWLNSSVTD